MKPSRWVGLLLCALRPARPRRRTTRGTPRRAASSTPEPLPTRWGSYEEALEYFQRSCELSGRAALLYNIATTAERVRADDLALRSYREYLELAPDTQHRDRVERRIAFLERQARGAPPDGGSAPGPRSTSDPSTLGRAPSAERARTARAPIRLPGSW